MTLKTNNDTIGDMVGRLLLVEDGLGVNPFPGFIQSPIKGFLTVDQKGSEKNHHRIADIAFSFLFFQCLTTHATAMFDNLINQKGQQVQRDYDAGQVLVSMTEIVFKVIAINLQGLEGLMFDATLLCNWPYRMHTSFLGVDLGSEVYCLSYRVDLQYCDSDIVVSGGTRWKT